MGRPSSIGIDDVRKLVEGAGATLITTEYPGFRGKIYFKCAQCGKQHFFTMRYYNSGVNRGFLCKDCQKEAAGLITFKDLKKIFEDKGAELLETEYINKRQQLHFKCSQCGKEHHTTYELFKNGYNTDFLCHDCITKRQDYSKARIYSIEQIREKFESKGAILLSTEYKNPNTHLHFKCSKCGNEHRITWSSYLQGQNQNLLCTDCLQGKHHNPFGYDGKNRRTLMDRYWYTLVYEFWNMIPDNYSAHHIVRYMQDTVQRRSVTNGYPLLKDLHSRGYTKEVKGILRKDPYHTFIENLKDFPDEAKLPYHTYENFKFIDLSSILRTEILLSEDQCNDNYKRKQELANNNIQLLQVYPEEVYIDRKRKIFLSSIRAKIYPKFKDIYKFTGTHLIRLYARNLKAVFISKEQAKIFCNENHIQGFISGEYYAGLVDESNVVQSVMILGKPRFNKNYDLELLRSCVAVDTLILGGFAKLFTFVTKNVKFKTIITYSDLRWSSVDPEDSVYVRNGFEFSHYSKPSYRWLDLDTNRIYSRMMTQKHKLERLLPDFDESLSESENLRLAGYLKLSDTGNNVFIFNK